MQLPPKTRRCPRKSNNSGRDTWMQKHEHFVRDFLQFSHFRHFIKQVGMSQSATPATQNGMTTCLETFEKERFCSSPHRHAEAAGKPDTRDETRGSIKTGISCETSSNFDTLQLQNRCFVRGFRQFSSHLTNATPATEFVPCCHLTQPWQCDSQKHATRHV